MDAGVWISLLALLVSVVSLGMSWVTMRRVSLFQLREILGQVEKVALNHLFIPGVSGAERELLSLHKKAKFVADRVRREEVRAASMQLLELCLEVPDKRGASTEEKDELKTAIENATRAVDQAIGDRVDALRPWHGLIGRSRKR